MLDSLESLMQATLNFKATNLLCQMGLVNILRDNNSARTYNFLDESLASHTVENAPKPSL